MLKVPLNQYPATNPLLLQPYMQSAHLTFAQ